MFIIVVDILLAAWFICWVVDFLIVIINWKKEGE